MNYPGALVSRKYAIRRIALYILLASSVNQFAYPQKPDDQPIFNGETRIYTTVRITSDKPRIDGILDDACWLEGVWGGDFRQQMPTEGAAPSQRTEFKILYDNVNIYVAIKAYDNEPDRIDRQMARRDERVGDNVGISLDSYFDRRTGFEFDLTAAGSKMDLLMTNDNFDVNWNPVWYGKVGTLDSGWIAEMQIPLSQLRYSKQEEQVWGLHIWRWINRNRESDHWNLIPRNNYGYMYHFGELHGLKNLPNVSRMEFMPYTVGKIKTYEEIDGNPYADGFDPGISVGLDGKFGLGSNFTVDYTINPDFGQVEADPSELNLTAFETYFEEKRPFFIEGGSLFDIGFDDNQLFYSRRIGHTPVYDPAIETGEYVQKPENTSILGALKLTGKTEKGFSIGILESLTSREKAKISSPEGNFEMVAEPLTNYLVGRIQQDINKSNTIIGAMISSANRDIQDDHLFYLAKSAITGGVDFRHYLKDKTFYIDFKALGSKISGSAEAITLLQTESSRYFQRPDAPHLELDTASKQLSGTGGSFEFIKGAKGKWRYGIGAHWSSPGLELNDLGFQSITDYLLESQSIAYIENIPKGIFRTYEVQLTQSNAWNFGGEFLRSEWDLEASSLFSNKWNFHARFDRMGKNLDVSLLRGGPGVYIFGQTGQDYFLSTDESKMLVFGLGYENNFSDDRISNRHEFHTELNWKITNSMQLAPEINYNKITDNYQYIHNNELEDQGRYLLGRLNRKIYEITIRINYAITPDFTIQYYGSPYVTTGHYSAFKTLADPDTENPENVFHTLTAGELQYNPTERIYELYDGIHTTPELSFADPDFNFRQFRSNLVARWEYKPGSVLYLVWTHNRTSSEDIRNDQLDYNLKGLFREHAENVFLIKFNYWFSL